MAGASTLHSLLFRLGFDTSQLATGSSQARSELKNVANAARELQSVAAPVAAAVGSIGDAGARTAANLRTLVTAEQAAAEAMKKRYAAAGPLVSAQQALAQSSGVQASASRGIVTSAQAAAEAMSMQYAAAGPLIASSNAAAAAQMRQAAAANALVTPQQAAANALRAANAAAGPLVQGLAGANGAMMAAAPAANLAAAGFQAVGDGGGMAANGLNQASSAAPRTITHFNNVTKAAYETASAAGFMQRTLSMAFAFSGGVAITNIISFVSNALIGFNSRLEQAHIAFATLLGDSAAGDKFIKDMERFAAFTPFDFAGVEDAAQRLLAMGVTADQVLPTLNAIGDAVAALGGNKEKLDRVVLAIGQMTTAGRVNAQDMRQLTEAGIPAWRMLADSIGKTVAETRDLAERGLIPAGQAVETLLNGMEERFGGMMARQSKTAQGAFSTIRDAAYLTISAAVEPVFAAISSGMVRLAEFLTSGGGRYVAPVIYGIAAALGLALIPRLWGAAAAVGGLEIAIGGLMVPILPLIIAVTTLGIAWQENFGGIRDSLGPILGAVGGALGTIAGAFAGLGLNADALAQVIVILAAIITTRFVMSAIAGTAAALGFAGAQIALAAAISGTTGAATVASVALGRLAGGMMALGAVIGTLMLPVTVIIGAIALLALNFDRVGQGIRVLELGFTVAVKGIVDAASHIPFVGDQFKGLSDRLQTQIDGIKKNMASAEAAIDAAEAAASGKGAGSSVDPLAEWLSKIESGASDVIGATEDLVTKFGSTMEGVVNASRNAGGEAMMEMANAIRDRQNAPLDALKNLHEMVRNQLEPTVEIARLVGMLSSQDLAVGLASGDPAVRAAAIATQKLITERLDELTGGAYSAGHNTTAQLAAGMMNPEAVAAIGRALENVGTPVAQWLDSLTGTKVASDVLTSVTGALSKAAGTMAVANDWKNKWAPSATAVANAMKGVNSELDKMRNPAALSALNAAFSDIEQAANRYFDTLHQRNLQAIDDARDQKNAILDAKAALNQAPVTAAQEALDFQRQQIQEWRLRQAVATAANPEAYRDAVLALRDFLAQKHIDEMQAQVDNAKEVIDAQKAANDAAAEARREAENARYAEQKERFERDLEQLRSYLEKHPGEWQNVQSSIISLLEGYGIPYKEAGAGLSQMFVDGLRENIADAVAAAKEYADIIPGILGSMVGMGSLLGQFAVGLASGAAIGGGIPGSTINYPYPPTAGGGYVGGGGNPYATPLDTGAFRIMQDELLALVHRDEMVVPRDTANLLRAIMGRSPASTGFANLTPGLSSDGSNAVSTSVGTGGGAEYHLYFGDEKLGEIVDHRLADQDRTYRPRGTVTLRSSR